MSGFADFSELAQRAPSMRRRDAVAYRCQLDAAAGAALEEATTDLRRSEVWDAWIQADSVIRIPRRGPMRTSDLPPRVESAMAEAYYQKLRANAEQGE